MSVLFRSRRTRMAFVACAVAGLICTAAGATGPDRQWLLAAGAPLCVIGIFGLAAGYRQDWL